jgi:hypothetical protein
MTEQSIPESSPCRSKTGRAIRRTGKKSAGPSALNGPGIAVKAVPPIQTAAPEMANHIPSPEAGLSLPSPTLTTIPPTANPTICGLGVSDATCAMTPNTTPAADSAPSNSLATISNRRSLNGANKKPTRQELLRAIQGDELALQQHSILLETYKPTMDAIKLYLEIHGSQSPNFYMTKNKQVSAACQMNGLNDPCATRKQRIAAMTCYELLMEAIMAGIESGLGKEQVKQMMNDAINRGAEFFNLGNKKAVAARMKAQRKAA